ncbi:hypothetical protein RBSWK_04634 [Rhodopirellula baltica SWK14]|uniref:Uncharacterized protein n=1 Tax=Rhodopirellula baltica SWK14 TaxID=993516 RepID=L7CBM1_RHOBT|nr:hypothetical protein RBSWK_04634 [Rhodopirellula baltica SWK14]
MVEECVDEAARRVALGSRIGNYFCICSANHPLRVALVDAISYAIHQSSQLDLIEVGHRIQKPKAQWNYRAGHKHR